MGSLLGGGFGGSYSSSASAKSDQTYNIENGLNSSFVVGDGNRVSSGTPDGSSPLSGYMPYVLIGGFALVALILYKRL